MTEIFDVAVIGGGGPPARPPSRRGSRWWRPMTPDGYPAYAPSATHRGAFVAVCHSGVTLSAAHSGILADCILAGRLSDFLSDMHPARFAGGECVHAA